MPTFCLVVSRYSTRRFEIPPFNLFPRYVRTFYLCYLVFSPPLDFFDFFFRSFSPFSAPCFSVVLRSGCGPCQRGSLLIAFSTYSFRASIHLAPRPYTSANWRHTSNKTWLKIQLGLTQRLRFSCHF